MLTTLAIAFVASAFGLAQLAVLFQAAYLFYPLAGALLARAFPLMPQDPPAAPPCRIAVLIAAHDEAAVIGGALDALAAQIYPAAGFDVFVVADNCHDQTAAIVRRTGATVLERFSDGPSTKGQALAWLWKHIRHRGHGGVVVLDADNQAAPDFLGAISAELSRGHPVVQGIRKAKNPDGGTAGLDALTELCTHRIGAAGRMWLGLGGPLMGSGVAYQAALFDRLVSEVGQTVVEDCEWQARLALEGTPVRWTDCAVVYDEKTARAEAMGTQRNRWMAGRGQVARAFFGPLMRRFTSSGDPLALDTALFLVAAPRSLLLAGMGGFFLLAALLPGLPGLWPAWVWFGACFGFVLYVLAGMWLDGAERRDYLRLVRGLGQLPRFTWQIAGATWKALSGAAVRWVPTPHGR